MAYREDEGLAFLQYMQDQELDNLVKLLIYDKDGKKWISESLSRKNGYKQHNPKHSLYWQDIAEEIQRYGANGIITQLRGGKGVLYKEVLTDVCDRLKVNYNPKAETGAIENNLLMKILTDSIEKMSSDDVRKIMDDLGIKNLNTLSGEALVSAFQAMFIAGGFKSYQLTLIVVNAISRAMLGRGLTFAGNAALTRAASIFAGPIGWAVTGVWTAFDLAGPAYRVTIPAVIHVAMLRKRSLLEKDGVGAELAKEMGI